MVQCGLCENGADVYMAVQYEYALAPSLAMTPLGTPAMENDP